MLDEATILMDKLAVLLAESVTVIEQAETSFPAVNNPEEGSTVESQPVTPKVKGAVPPTTLN